MAVLDGKMKIFCRIFPIYFDIWDFFCNFAARINVRIRKRIHAHRKTNVGIEKL